MKVIRNLEKGYRLIQTDYENWISFWIKDPHGDDIETFASVKRAMDWWKMNKEEILNKAETPEWRRARKEAVKLVKRMGAKLESLPEDEQKEFIEQCL